MLTTDYSTDIVYKLETKYINNNIDKKFENNLEKALFFIDKENTIWTIQEWILKYNKDYNKLISLDTKSIDAIYDRYLHKKTNNYYRLLHYGKNLLNDKIIDVIIYMSELNNNIWIRPKDNFFDGRFEHIKYYGEI